MLAKLRWFSLTKQLQRIAAFSLLSFALVGCSQQPTMQDLNGKPVHLADYRGKWVVINYWASWCEPCSEEIPELNAFYFAHKDKDAVVLGFNYEQLTADELPALIQRMGVLFPSLITDPGPLLGVISVPGLPASFLIGPDGKLKKVLVGEQTQKSLEAAMALKPTTVNANSKQGLS